ncbi:MAG: MarR family transcriptional regulator [Actinobacteria bacterium]|nr:MarR family transcriptional regulator [Actinomycetota bacterium]MCB9413533.1 MarR family transcriptional regulator [Actinomycetota bacterium]
MDPTTTEEDVAAIAADVHVAVMKLARRLRTEWTEELTATQVGTLGSVVREGPMPISALAAREGVRAPSMTRTVKLLEAKSLVARSQDPDDARVVVVSATDAGRAAVERIRRARRAWLAEQLARRTPGELAALRAAAPILTEVAQS